MKGYLDHRGQKHNTIWIIHYFCSFQRGAQSKIERSIGQESNVAKRAAAKLDNKCRNTLLKSNWCATAIDAKCVQLEVDKIEARLGSTLAFANQYYFANLQVGEGRGQLVSNVIIVLYHKFLKVQTCEARRQVDFGHVNVQILIKLCLNNMMVVAFVNE